MNHQPQCPWCRQHPGELHFDALGFPLIDRWHRAGRAIEAMTIDRINAREKEGD